MKEAAKEAARVVLCYEQIAEAIRDYVEKKRLAPKNAISVVVSLEAEGGFFSDPTFTAEVTFK